MRHLSSAFLLALSATALRAADDLTVLPNDPADPPRKMLSTYLRKEAAKAFDARRTAVAALKTPADVAKRAADLRAKFVEAIGGLPEKTPLNARVVGREDFDGYSVERVIYESRPNHHVTAVVFLPPGKGPFPAVLFPCGHSGNGKASYQRACVLLCRLGIAAMSYDPIGQGERRQLLDDTGKPVIKSMTDEHTMVSVGGMLVGRNTAGYRIWDGIRSIDYLAGRADIDAKRLGCTGVSGGGTLTSYLMALDDRILAAAPSCYITSLERLFATIGPQDGEQNIPGQVAFGMEHADYITMRAPRPTLLLTATKDFFDIDGAWTSYREAKRIYALLGHGERADILEVDGGHGYPKAHREAMARWMCRWLLGKDVVVVEGDLTVPGDAKLLCTKSGQVLTEFRGKSVFDLTADAEKELAVVRAKLWKEQPKEKMLAEVRKLLNIPAVVPPARFEAVAGEIKRDGYTITKGVFTTEPGIKLPVLFLTPDNLKKDSPVVINVDTDGKSAWTTAPAGLEINIKSGKQMVMLDARAYGETASAPYDRRKPTYFGRGWFDTWVSIHLNRSLLAQRTYDLLAVLAYFGDNRPLQLVGFNAEGITALHAAALDPRVRHTMVAYSLYAWSAVVAAPVSYDQLPYVVPGALRLYDLPDLAAAIAPRGLFIGSPYDAAGKRGTDEAMDKAYARCREAYRAAGAEDQLFIRVPK